MLIYKYPVPFIDWFVIEMPENAKILSFQEQNSLPVLWALVCPDNPVETRRFHGVGTGYAIDLDVVKEFIGTIQLMNGKFVWHLFEMKND